jgi:YaiO family outer membrane protein
VDFYYADRDYIGFIVANGEEAESVGLGRLLVSDIETYGLTGQHWLTESWALTWTADYHQQGKVYTRQGIYVGVKHKF